MSDVTHWTREMWTKDLVFEVLIRKYMGSDMSEAMKAVMGQIPEIEDLRSFEDKVTLMYQGWVIMNDNLRPWMKR